ncbi:acVLRF1 family peptidyl-tRNA hydrolase [Aestuariimicrobium soli]|uniref:acVLRF1 family peptidyl-tRNA hydrolase n=1 Tax=Aestuariimicrobium soli TaxID=2035834 RepID=UPI003EB96765
MSERCVSVPAERVVRWFENFAARHGEYALSGVSGAVVAEAADGARAEVRSGWGPIPAVASSAELARWVGRDRRVGVLLVRKGAHAVGIFSGLERETSKVDTHYVQGRTKAGGWSQQRYARRRDNQATKALAEAADEAVRLLLPEVDRLEALVCGGDGHAVTTVLADRRLEALRGLVSDHGVLPTPEPRQATLAAVVEQARAVTITLNELA